MKYFRIRDEKPTVMEWALMMIVEQEGRDIRTYKVWDNEEKKMVTRRFYKIKPRRL